jgi:hypothetical protein
MDVTNLIPLAEALPEALAHNALELLEKMGSVIEGVGDEDITWKPPLLKVVQATTDRSALPKGTTIGDMVVGDEKVEGPFSIIPLRLWDSRQMWSPDKDDNRILCWSPDATMGMTGQACRTCQFQVFDTVENKVACTKNKTFLVISSDLRHLFQVNFSKSNYSQGVEFQGLLKKAGVATHRRQYTLATESSKKVKNVEALVATPVSLPDGNVAPELRPFLEALFNQISDDRKAHLNDFKVIASTRAEQARLSGPAEEESPQGLIEATAETASSEQSDQAQKYTL